MLTAKYLRKCLTSGGVTYLALLTVISMNALEAGAVEIHGTVSGTSGKPLAGAFVTIQGAKTKIEISRVTDTSGHYSINYDFGGPYQVTVRRIGWHTKSWQIENTPSASLKLDADLLPKEKFYEDLPAGLFMTLLPDGNKKKELLLNCNSCHQIDYHRVTDAQGIKDADAWLETITAMRGYDTYALIPPDFNDREYASWLAKHLTAENFKKLAIPKPQSSDVYQAVYTEYPVLRMPSLPHDLVVGPDGRIWITAFLDDEIWALDPKTGEYQSFHVNERNDVLADVRALKFDNDGMLWVVLGTTHSIVRLDPKNGSIKTYDIGVYAHDLDIDHDGNIWFNGYFTKPEQIGVLNTKTGQVTLYPIPSAGLTEAEGKPLPYGLQMDRQGIVWNTALGGNTLVSFDPRSKKAELFWMPTQNSGPRRLAVGVDDSIWIPEWAVGKLARFNPKEKTFEEFDTGLSSLGPYDVQVNKVNGDVWMSGTINSSILRFDTKKKTFTEFPWPTNRGYVRHIAVDERTGAIWSAYSAYPDERPRIVRLEIKDKERSE